MEIKVNKEIRNYTESIFFGLSIRQFIFSVIACAVAVILYLTLKRFLGIETLSWICILGAFPFAVLGFIKYNGMPAERLIMAFIKSEILTPKKLVFKAQNIYKEMFNLIINKNLKQGLLKSKKEYKEITDKKILKDKSKEETKNENSK